MTTNDDQYAAGGAAVMLHCKAIDIAVAKDPTLDFACMVRANGVRS